MIDVLEIIRDTMFAGADQIEEGQNKDNKSGNKNKWKIRYNQS